jgi:hypothetical protein
MLWAGLDQVDPVGGTVTLGTKHVARRAVAAVIGDQHLDGTVEEEVGWGPRGVKTEGLAGRVGGAVLINERPVRVEFKAEIMTRPHLFQQIHTTPIGTVGNGVVVHTGRGSSGSWPPRG